MLSSRRGFLTTVLAGPVLPALLPGLAAGQQVPMALPTTPECRDDDAVTIAEEEGPYFKPNTPLRRDLAVDSPRGERVTLAGYVLDRRCQPTPDALVELWQADETGVYDNEGYRLRGHQLTDGAGRWWFTTIIPGLYSGRTRHYHVKVQRPGGRVLTTQLYFPDEPRNARDGLFDRRLLLDIRRSADGRFCRYDLVVA